MCKRRHGFHEYYNKISIYMYIFLQNVSVWIAYSSNHYNLLGSENVSCITGMKTTVTNICDLDKADKSWNNEII